MLFCHTFQQNLVEFVFACTIHTCRDGFAHLVSPYWLNWYAGSYARHACQGKEHVRICQTFEINSASDARRCVVKTITCIESFLESVPDARCMLGYFYHDSQRTTLFVCRPRKCTTININISSGNTSSSAQATECFSRTIPLTGSIVAVSSSGQGWQRFYWCGGIFCDFEFGTRQWTSQICFQCAGRRSKWPAQLQRVHDRCRTLQ